MKLMIKLASVSSTDLEVIKYTGESGLYSAVQPTEPSFNFIDRLAYKLGFNVDPDSVHCTVMYSPYKCPNEVECDSEHVYRATPTFLQHWYGHDKKGYITLALRSPELEAEHRRLKDLGCEATFPDYNPHVTIWSGIALTPELKRKMAELSNDASTWPHLRFTKQFIGDIKKD